MSERNFDDLVTGEINWSDLRGEVQKLRGDTNLLREDIERSIEHRTFVSRMFTALTLVVVLVVGGVGFYIVDSRTSELEEAMQVACERHVELRGVFIEFIDTLEMLAEEPVDDHPLLDLREELMRNPCPHGATTGGL